MPSIPTYQRQFMPQGDLVGARANTNNAPDDAIGGALRGIAQQGMGMATTMMRVDTQQEAERKREAEADAAHSVRILLPEGEVHFQKETTADMQGWKVGDPDLVETVGKKFDTWVTENTEKLPTPASKKYFIEHAATMKARLQTGVFTHMEQTKKATYSVQNELALQKSEKLVEADPSRRDELFKQTVDPMIATSTDSAATIKEAAIIKNRLALAAALGKMRSDPAKYYQENFGEMAGAAGGGATSGGFDAVMQGVFRHEGGYNPKDGGNGAPVNFGINQGHNPDIDVKNLTKAEAAKLYKTRYWDKIGGDTLPPELQGTAMDAAVNQGPANAKKWIDASGGDPVKFNALRRAHYEGLLKNPENEKYRGTWMRRLAEYETGRTGPAAAPGAPPGDGVRSKAVVVSDPALDDLRYDQVDNLRRMNETMVKQGEAQFKASAERAVSDAIAGHKDGVLGPELQPELFDRAYGADGQRLYGEYQQSREMGSDISKFKTQSEGEIAAEIQSAEPKPGDGYAAADARRNIRVQAAQQVLQARKTDPAGYVVATSDSLARQRAAIDNPQTPADQRPAMVQKFVGESLAEQQRLGIRNPTILTPGQADAIAKRAMAAVKPEDSANLIAGLESEYGGYFPKVFGELVKEGKISGDLLIIPNLPSQTAREAVSRLARIKETDLSNGIDAKVQKDVKDAVTMKLGEFTRAIPFPNDQAAGVVSAYESSMRKLAYQFVQSGQDGTTAADNAQKMLLGHYQFDDTMRVPKGFDLSQIKYGTKKVLEQDLTGIDTPRDLVGARTPAEVATEWQKTVQARPQWFTSDDDKGLTLYAQGENGTRYPVTRGGQPVKYSWEQLKAKTPAGFTFGGFFGGFNASMADNQDKLQKQQAEEAKVQARAARSFTAQ